MSTPTSKNRSSAYPSSRLNSTAISGQNEFRKELVTSSDKNKLPISPIPAYDGARNRFSKRLIDYSKRGPSPLIQKKSDETTGVFEQTNSADNSSCEDDERLATSAQLTTDLVNSCAESGYSSGLLASSKAVIDDEESTSTPLVHPTSSSSSDSPEATPNSSGRNDKTPNATSATVSSTVAKITNPFESCLLESMQMTTFSPSVFANVVSPGANHDGGNFRWSIDHIAVLNPADIDEHQVVESPDEEREKMMHSAIDHFWASQKAIAPSPMSDNGGLPEIQESARKRPFARGLTTNSTQTTLTFPPELDLVQLLGGCFTFNEETDESCANTSEINLSMNTLRRKLFGGEKRGAADQSMNNSDDDNSDRFSSTQAAISSSPVRGVNGEMSLSSSCLDRQHSPMDFDNGSGDDVFAELDDGRRPLSSAGSMPFHSPDLSPIKKLEDDI